MCHNRRIPAGVERVDGRLVGTSMCVGGGIGVAAIFEVL